MVVTAKRDKAAAKFLKRIMKKYGRPRKIVTDGLRAYSAAMREVGNADRQEVGRGLNNRAENSHQPFRRRERAMQRFRSMKTLQKFSSVHAQVHNHFHHERHLITRQVYKQRRWPSGAPSRLECRLRVGVLRHALTTCRYSDKAASRLAAPGSTRITLKGDGQAAAVAFLMDLFEPLFFPAAFPPTLRPSPSDFASSDRRAA